MERTGGRLSRASEWVETHPAAAWTLTLLLILAVVGWQASSWWRNDFPEAWFHAKADHRFDDLGVVMARASEATAGDLWSYWFGPQIDRVGWFRPIPSTLWVLQYRWFGEDDRSWNLVSLALYLLMVLALAWMAASVWSGPRWQRLAVGLAAALVFGGPGFAGYMLHYWMLTWWPSQPDILSLLFGALLLGAVVRYARTEDRRWAYLAPVLFLLGVLCKEMAYVAGAGACLILVRQPRCRPLLVLLAVEGLCLFLYRSWALQGFAPGGWLPGQRVVKTLLGALRMERDLALEILPAHMVPLAFAVGAALVLRRRWSPGPCACVFLASYLAVSWVLLGAPWESQNTKAWHFFGSTLWTALVLVGLWKLGCRWPYPEILAIAALAWAIGESHGPHYGWYRIWGGALLRVVAVLAAAAAADHAARSILSRREASSRLPIRG